MLNFNQPAAFVQAYLYVDEYKYEIETFKIQFTQPTDYKGQPQHETKGGPFMITLSQGPDNMLLRWAKNSHETKNGELVFQTDLGITVYRIIFENAYCVTMSQFINAMTGTKISFMLSPERIILNGIEHDNFWPK